MASFASLPSAALTSVVQCLLDDDPKDAGRLACVSAALRDSVPLVRVSSAHSVFAAGGAVTMHVIQQPYAKLAVRHYARIVSRAAADDCNQREYALHRLDQLRTLHLFGAVQSRCEWLPALTRLEELHVKMVAVRDGDRAVRQPCVPPGLQTLVMDGTPVGKLFTGTLAQGTYVYVCTCMHYQWVQCAEKRCCTCVAALAPATTSLRTLEIRHFCPESADLGETLGGLLHLTAFSLTAYSHECYGGLSRLPLGLRSLRVEVFARDEEVDWDMCDAACDRVEQLRALEHLVLRCWLVPSDNPGDHPALRELDLNNDSVDDEFIDRLSTAYRAAGVAVV